MQLELVPLLQTQRDLYDLPRGMERFKAYIDTMVGDSDDIALPLGAMNPMGKPHVAALLDTLLAMDAEGIATTAVAEARQRLQRTVGQCEVALVVADDAQGGWTNRHLFDAKQRFTYRRNAPRQWAVALLWTSDEPSAAYIRAEVLAAIYRTAYLARHGEPQTLDAWLRQEGLVAQFAGAQSPLDGDDLAYTREVIAPYRDNSDFPTLFTCFYGDAAAVSVGYQPLGLSAWAGYALAIDDAQRSGASPAAAL